MKLMIACAFSYDAKLLILDEPTSGLDPVSRDELLKILSEYIEDGEHSVLFSTHITCLLYTSAQTPTGGSSGEYCKMEETLMQRRRVSEEVIRYVKLYQQGR